ncbi:MAG: pentapeptide repeat-containing protein [Leptodesmis sp.]|uniref:pentapeptide repeat-containing protein n=1 Tax=Leptodesmis sp. TaxID=3100501 RepID=UPI003D0C9F90
MQGSSWMISGAMVVTLATASIAANPEQVKRLVENLDCQACNLSEVTLYSYNLEGANLQGANLTAAALQGLDKSFRPFAWTCAVSPKFILGRVDN